MTDHRTDVLLSSNWDDTIIYGIKICPCTSIKITNPIALEAPQNLLIVHRNVLMKGGLNANVLQIVYGRKRGTSTS